MSKTAIQYLISALLWGGAVVVLGSCALTTPQIADRSKASLVLINYRDRGGHGTGFVIEQKGNQCLVLTAAHVVRGESPENLNLTTEMDQVLHQNPAIEVSDTYDVALLRFRPTNADRCPYRSLPLGNSDHLAEGGTVFVRGYPQREGAATEVSQFESGTISSIANPLLPNGLGISYTLTSVAGMSGSPVLNPKGQVIAIHSKADETDGGIEHFKWGIPLNLAKAEFGLDKPGGNAANQPLPSNPAPTSLPPTLPSTQTPTPPTPPPTPTLSPTPPSFLGLPVQSFGYTSARVSATGQVSPYDATGKRYTETALNLPAGAVPLEMVAIEGGTFLMGSPESEADRDSDESPQHEVTVPDFFMGQYEVTQAQYAAVMGNNPASFKGDNNPVENVSWDDAQAFIQRLNRLTGKTYRLPTESEWEYAARAGTTTPFSYGETITPEVVNYDGNSPYGNAPKGEYRQRTIAVDTLYPNPWGLYHIHGNVWEWVEDGWHDNYNGAPTDGTAWVSSDGKRGLRGGSWISDAWDTRSAYRYWDNRVNRSYGIGFRVVLVP